VNKNVIIVIAVTTICVVIVAFGFNQHINETKLVDEEKMKNKTESTSVNSSSPKPVMQEERTTGTSKGTYAIAFVKNTFTRAAYNHAFYDFYTKYRYAPENTQIYSDLNLLTAIPPDPPKQNTPFFRELKDRTIKLLPNSVVVTINDEDIHNGNIFYKSGNNVFDILIIGHDEYVTQEMYDNYRKFVTQGGVLIALDGNIFYGEVSYNPDYYSVTLVKGHGWEYNGAYAKKSVDERWYNETSSWIGSNYYDAYRWKYENGTYMYQYQNDPFNYGPVRWEDQFVTNQDDQPILDYQLDDPTHKVITYWKSYVQGKVIVLGIASEKVADNPSFQEFYDKLILEHAVK